MLYNRREANNILGCILNDTNLLRNTKFDICLNDFDDMFHKLLFGAITNISLENEVTNIDAVTMDTYLSKFPIQHETFKVNKGIEYVRQLKQYCNKQTFNTSYVATKKFSMLRKFKAIGMDTSEIYNENLLVAKEIQDQEVKLENLSLEDIKLHFKKKFLEIDEEFKSKSDSYEIDLGEGLEELIESCKLGEVWGHSFQSRFFNTIFKGLRGSNLIIRSGTTGLGKTRASIGDMVNISATKWYDKSTRQWIVNANPVPSLFVSTELTKKELQLVFIASISDVDEESIKTGEFTQDEEVRITEALEVLRNSPIKTEFCSNFCIEELENVIVKHIINSKCGLVFFDYIQITSNLAQELIGLFGYVIREDSMLQQLSSALKNIANRYDVCIITATQVTRNIKTDPEIDVTHLRGGQATGDKADIIAIGVRLNAAEREKIKHITDSNFGVNPTHAYHICKNRGGKWNRVIVWVNINLDTIRVTDCFVTNYDYELLDIEPTVIKVG